MAEPAFKEPEDQNQSNQPYLRAIPGGGQSTEGRANLKLLDQQESNPEKPNSGSIEDQEKNGSNVIQGPWANNFSGINNIQQAKTFFGFAKEKGPLTAIITIVITIAASITGLSLPVFMTQSILGNLIQKINAPQETSMTIRTNKLFASKMVNNYTSGYCGTTVTILCKFTRPSNRFLTQLEKNGIKALDAEGNVISKNGIFPNARPTKYSFTTATGGELNIEAKDLYTQIVSNSELRAAFHNASKTRFISLTDSVFKSIKTRFGFNTNDRLSSTTDDANLNNEINDNVRVSDNGVRAAAADGGVEAENAARAIITEEANTSVSRLAQAGKGDAFGLVAGGVCLASDIPSLVTRAARAYQMSQLIKYSMVFLSAFGAIKAGDATPQEVNAIGDKLTKEVDGKSAMDSFGIQYVISGNTNPKNSNYKKFVPGIGAIAALSGVNSVLKSKVKTDACNIAMNPITGQGINVILAANAVDTLGLSLLVAAGNILVGYAAASIIEAILPGIISGVMGILPINSILNLFMGDLTQNLSGEQVGDALVSGASHVMGQTSNAGGNMPLTVTQAVAYNNLTNQVQLAYAEEDKATKSPFDISSPNTMLGSIVHQLIPYYAASNAAAGSISNNFSFISKVIMGSFSTILKPLSANAASTDEAQYQLCDDPSIKNNDIAAGPYCNIIYGVPTQYIDEDPVTVVNNLIKSGDIDDTTGEPIAKKGLESWITLCTNGSTDEAENCKITDQKTSEYALYTIDHRIQKSMDEDQ